MVVVKELSTFNLLYIADKIGITIPIIPDLMPIDDIKKIPEFASYCKATIPEKIRKRFESIEDESDEMRKAGIDIAIEQCLELYHN